MLAQAQRPDARELVQRVDCRELAEALGAELFKKTAKEYAGPCPRCKGHDRFTVRSDMWFCRQCKPWRKGRRLDALDLIQHVKGCDFNEAYSYLAEWSAGLGATSAHPLEKKSVRRRPPKLQEQPSDFHDRAQREQTAAEARLLRGRGTLAQRGRDYLYSRGLTLTTAETWGLGVLTHYTFKANCLCIPWYGDGGQIVGVNYRFFEPITIEQGGKERQYKYRIRAGSQRSLFGCQHLRPCHDKLLIATEGEMNALSIWQVARAQGWPVDVVSFGTESAPVEPLQELAPGYGAVVVWADKREAGDEIGKALDEVRGGVDVWESPNGQDANDLLAQGLLQPFLQVILAELYKRLSLRIATAYEDAIGSDKELLLARHERLDAAGVAMVKAGLM